MHEDDTSKTPGFVAISWFCVWPQQQQQQQQFQDLVVVYFAQCLEINFPLLIAAPSFLRSATFPCLVCPDLVGAIRRRHVETGYIIDETSRTLNVVGTHIPHIANQTMQTSIWGGRRRRWFAIQMQLANSDLPLLLLRTIRILLLHTRTHTS